MEDSQHKASAIRGVMIQKKEALKHMKRKVIELEEDLGHFVASHLPHNHNLRKIMEPWLSLWPKPKILLNLLYLTCVYTGVWWLCVHRSYGVTRVSTIRRITPLRLSTFTNDGCGELEYFLLRCQ